jgi:hypothetical protein
MTKRSTKLRSDVENPSLEPNIGIASIWYDQTGDEDSRYAKKRKRNALKNQISSDLRIK